MLQWRSEASRFAIEAGWGSAPSERQRRRNWRVSWRGLGDPVWLGEGRRRVRISPGRDAWRGAYRRPGRVGGYALAADDRRVARGDPAQSH